MLNNFVAMAVLVCTVGATNIQALSIDSVGVMTHDDPALPTTGFALAFTDPGGFLSATTAASPGNVIFNVNARVSCLRLLDTEEQGSTHILRLIVGGTTTESAVVDIPEVGPVNLGRNDYVGLIEVTVPNGNGYSHVVHTRRGNFLSEFEACVGDAPAGQFSAGFPQGDMNFCKAQDFSTINYVDCDDVIEHFSAWAPHLATDRTLMTGNTVLEE